MTNPRFQIVQLLCGTVITLGVVAAWLWGKVQGVDTTELMAFAVPIVGALFLVSAVNKAGDAAQQAAIQTNGQLEARVRSAVASALAARDAARTRQAQGDVSEASGMLPTYTTEGPPYHVELAPAGQDRTLG